MRRKILRKIIGFIFFMVSLVSNKVKVIYFPYKLTDTGKGDIAGLTMDTGTCESYDDMEPEDVKSLGFKDDEFKLINTDNDEFPIAIGARNKGKRVWSKDFTTMLIRQRNSFYIDDQILYDADEYNTDDIIDGIKEVTGDGVTARFEERD